MTTDKERLRALEVRVEGIEDELKTISRNTWAVLGAVALLVAKYLLDRIDPGVSHTTTSATMFAAAWMHFLSAVI